ncbi:hypothetical protein CCP3SC5AM1_410003 [Gammaproteobacteria bacterium]
MIKSGGGWGCPHEVNGICQHVNGKNCDPGMKGCVLFGRFIFSDPTKNRSEKSHHITQRLKQGVSTPNLDDRQSNEI